jgi:UDP-N-acetylmuramate--alanine ligase
MLPLAMILRAKGYAVEGSDRSLDQGRLGPKFEFLRRHGIGLHAQDGSGVTAVRADLVTSAPSKRRCRTCRLRGGSALDAARELLAQLFNAAPQSIAVGGTSGKSTTTGMIGWILQQGGRDPTIMNGAIMKNFITAQVPFASAAVGGGEVFVSEVDESDGSIALFHPRIAVVGNISLDHKTMNELRSLFRAFVNRPEDGGAQSHNKETKAGGTFARH